MRKERITDKEAFCTVFLFIIGSSYILGTGGIAKNDAWISGIFGILLSIPIILVYARILSIFPEKGLFEILDLVLGKVLGKIITLFYIWYSFHLGALVIRNFGEFFQTVAMPETPFLVPMITLGIVCIVAARSGIEVIGRLSAYMLPVIIFTIFVVQLLGIPHWKFYHIQPILYNGLIPVLKGGFSTFAFPLAESVIFIGAFFSLKTKRSAYKVYLNGTIFAGLLLVTLTIRNILILGELLPSVYFPSYTAVSRIAIGDFLQRMELTVVVVLVFGVVIKSSLCLLVSSIGIAKLFNLHDYRSIVIQTGILMVYLSYTVYVSTFEMRNWAVEVYPYYAFPFQVISPLIILLFAEIKRRNANKRSINAIN